MEINDTYLVVDIETKEVFGHYDTPGKAKGQVKRKGERYAVYTVTAIEPLGESIEEMACQWSQKMTEQNRGNPKITKEPIKDLSHWYWCIEDCQKWMQTSLVDTVRCKTDYGRRGNDEVTEIFKYQGKFYKITVEIEWNRYDKQFYYVDGSSVKSCEEVECPE